jgi:hypothetical protein
MSPAWCVGNVTVIVVALLSAHEPAVLNVIAIHAHHLESEQTKKEPEHYISAMFRLFLYSN